VAARTREDRAVPVHSAAQMVRSAWVATAAALQLRQVPITAATAAGAVAVAATMEAAGALKPFVPTRVPMAVAVVVALPSLSLKRLTLKT
jgi:hypothetical protein